ncbi:NAD(+) synthase [Kitasatospora sp. NPDC058115]|uniref:NAD(+) synthase n=1 Tax=Kitasatospora sp. NPDC058115 TaxID=3346347 RepID=UPI0036D83C7A
MSVLRVALAQCNPVLGDIPGNGSTVLRWSRKAVEAGADLVAFPELMLTGCPVQDLGLRSAFTSASLAGLSRLAGDLEAEGLGDTPVVVGYLDPADPADPALSAGEPGSVPCSAAAVLHRGEVAARYLKAPGSDLPAVRIRGVDVVLLVGDDLHGNAEPLATAGAGLVLHLSAAPYQVGSRPARKAALARLAAAAGAPVASVNMVGGQDDVVFAGGSMVVDPGGQCLAAAGLFTDDLLVAELTLSAAGAGGGPLRRLPRSTTVPDAPAPVPEAAPLLELPDIWRALVVGTRDYARKNGFATTVVALSGGIDSALVAVIAADALGAANVAGISMPGDYSSEHSKADAAELARRVGLDFRTVPIQPIVDAMPDVLRLDGIAAENIQARARGMILMAVSNQEDRLPLNTGNKTEYSCGHNTLYGDQVGGYAPLKDVPKTLVWALARWRNDQARRRGEPEPIPDRTITKEPSPELQPGQVDSELLPAPYEVLDEILAGYVEADLSRDELVARGASPAVVDQLIEMVERGEFKRRQAPPGPRVSRRAFGPDRRMPITNQFVPHGHRATYFPHAEPATGAGAP